MGIKSVALITLILVFVSGYGIQTPAQTYYTSLPRELNIRSLIDSEYSDQLERIVMVSSEPSQLHIYDPITENDVTVDLPLPPNCVSVGPNGIYAAVGHDAFISYVNLQNATVEKMLDVSADVFDIVLAGNGYVYAMPRRDQWENIRCIEIAKNIETLHSGNSVYAGTQMKLHPAGKAIYGADNGISPSDIEKYSIENGTAKYLYDSPYHGDYSMGGDLWISEDGLRIFTKSGNAFKSSEVQDQDMKYNGSLKEVGWIRHLSHSQENHKIFAIPLWIPGFSKDQKENLIFVYDDKFLAFETTITLPDFLVNGKQYSANGRFVFANSSGTKHFVVVESDESSGFLFPYGIVLIAEEIITAVYPSGKSITTWAQLKDSRGFSNP